MLNETSEEFSSTLNVTNITTFANSTLEHFDVPKELELAGFFLALTLSFIGFYIFINIQRYLESKAPGTKTLMDEFYIKLITYWVLEGTYCLSLLAVMIFWVDLPWGLAVLLPYIYLLIGLATLLHLLFSLLCYSILIFNPALIEEIDDKKIIRTVM